MKNEKFKVLCSMFKVQSDSSLEEVRVKAYGKGELAEMYYPDSSPSWALRLFNADLRRMPGLTDALRARGWRPSARLLRIDWVRIIFEAIGPP